ncbi:MAG TPA: SIS domain-containing protein [Opitutaceae bacterium]|jgi:D-sedoheptulose 7-phosphate isomerase
MTPGFATSYCARLEEAMRGHDWGDLVPLADALEAAERDRRQVLLCGNGGSAANAMHLANDLIWAGRGPGSGGLHATALPANAAVLTCLANDAGYEEIFSQQIARMGREGDLLIAFSGSGNSPNIVRALETARELGLVSFAILGFSGGRCLGLADHPIHFAINDMQVAEDLQLVAGHMVMQELLARRAAVAR